MQKLLENYETSFVPVKDEATLDANSPFVKDKKNEDISDSYFNFEKNEFTFIRPKNSIIPAGSILLTKSTDPRGQLESYNNSRAKPKHPIDSDSESPVNKLTIDDLGDYVFCTVETNALVIGDFIEITKKTSTTFSKKGLKNYSTDESITYFYTHYLEIMIGSAVKALPTKMFNSENMCGTNISTPRKNLDLDFIETIYFSSKPDDFLFPFKLKTNP